MNDKPTKEVKTLPVITKFIMTIGELPTSYLMSMTYLEQVTWLCNYLEKTVIPALNQNAQAVKELQELYELLRTYVNEYFDNLDIQTEVNNKLDEMAESGELAEIIAQYLEVSSVLGFDTKATLKSADNLVNGSITRTLGESTYNDGKGSYYKIRTVTTGDTIDDNNILALANFPTLIAEKIIDYRMNQAESSINNIINNIIPNLNSRKILFIGDSYLSLGNGTDGIIDKFKNISGETNVIYSVYGGTGFDYTVDSKNFVTLLNAVPNDDDITDIIVIGGYNDQYSDQSNVLTAINTFCTNAKVKFPNAQVYIGMVGFTLETNKRYPIYQVYQTYSKCNQYGAIYLNGVECIMHDTSLFVGDNDLTHPNTNGRYALAVGIYQAWKQGDYSYNYPFHSVPFTYSGDVTSGNLTLHGFISNNITWIGSQNNCTLEFANRPSYPDVYTNRIELGTFTLNTAGSIISPWPYNMYSIPVSCAVRDNAGYRNMHGKIIFLNNKFYLQIMAVESGNWTDINSLIEITINFFQATFPTQII